MRSINSGPVKSRWIEKAFASAGSSGDADAGLSQRFLATLLTWMQERESGVFLAATSNNISVLPPEIMRKGRFDEIFFVDLPHADVRAALFELHLKKRGRVAGSFDLENFPRGYGEENDFCMRAAAAGFRNVLCTNAYVAHEGGVSFSESTQTLMKAGAERLLVKHPTYDVLVSEWIARDPARHRREQIAAILQR